jgi:hypothetical protein
MDYYSAIKKNEIVMCKKMDGTGDHRVKQNKADSYGETRLKT